MNQIATTIEQSKRLIDSGMIRTETADCHWHFPVCKREEAGYTIYPEPDLYVGWVFSPDDVPAWSIGALWKELNSYGRIYEFPTTLSPEELIEKMVKIIEHAEPF